MQYSIYLRTSQTREKSKCRAVKESISFCLAASSLNMCIPFKASNWAVQEKKQLLTLTWKMEPSGVNGGSLLPQKTLLRVCRNKLLM